MTRKVAVRVLPDGSVQADFIGFRGEDCLEEADRLADTLARFGLSVDPTVVRKKTQAEIEDELGTGASERDRVPTPNE